MSTYNIRLQVNNLDLQSLIDKANAYPILLWHCGKLNKGVVAVIADIKEELNEHTGE